MPEDKKKLGENKFQNQFIAGFGTMSVKYKIPAKQLSSKQSVALKTLGAKKLSKQRWQPRNGCNDVNANQ